MNGKQYRNALRNMHGLVDELEDVTMENRVLAHENSELEKDVSYIANKHNENVQKLRDIANETRQYRVGSATTRHYHCGHECDCYDCCERNRCPYYQEHCDCQKQQIVTQIVEKPKKTITKVVTEEEEVFDSNSFMLNLCKKATNCKWKLVFAIALALVLLLAIGASPSNIVSWQAFTDLYIEYVCNPATMAMSVALVILLYKGIVKSNKK